MIQLDEIDQKAVVVLDENGALVAQTDTRIGGKRSAPLLKLPLPVGEGWGEGL